MSNRVGVGGRKGATRLRGRPTQAYTNNAWGAQNMMEAPGNRWESLSRKAGVRQMDTEERTSIFREQNLESEQDVKWAPKEYAEPSQSEDCKGLVKRSSGIGMQVSQFGGEAKEG